MEKIMNILKPGKSKDDETLYGSGHGEGSHLGNATNTPSNTTNPTSTHDQHASGVENTGLGATPGQTTQSGLHTGQGSHFAGASGQSSTLPSHTSGVTTTTTTQTHTGTSSGTTSGPHTSNLANRADPRVDSDNSRLAQSGSGTAQNSGLSNAQIGGSTGQSTHSGLTGNPQTTGTGVSGTNPTSNSQLGRDAAALGGAGVVGSGLHSHAEHDRGLGSTTGSSNLAQTSHAGTNPSYTQGTNNPNREAAVIGGSGALGSGVHSHQNREAGLTSSQHTGSHGPHTTNTANLLDPAVNTRARGHEDGIHHSPISGGGAEEADRHHGGDLTESAAALGRGQHQTDRNTGIGSTGIGSATGPAPHTAGPHQKDIANVIDPRVNPNNAAGQGAQAVPQTGSHSTADSSGHHYGRDAALGAGAVGAAGLAGSQHHNNQTGSNIGSSNTSTSHQSTSASGLSSGPAPNTAGPHSSDLLNRADPRVTADPQGNSQAYSTLGQSDRSHASTGGHADQSSIPHDKDYNYGKDAAIAGGATSAFVGAGHLGQSGTNSGHHGTSTTSQDPYSTSSTQRSADDPTTSSSRDHHLGRDAAVAGGAAGVGGAAHEANHHKHEKELAKAQREAEKEYKHDQKQAEKDHKHEMKRAEKHAEKEDKHDEKKKGGFLSFLHRDKSKKYSAEEEADFDRQEREHNAAQSHTGRNAALGGAAVAGTGAASVAHHDADTNKSLPTAPGNHGIGTGAGTQNALAGNTTSTGHDSATHGTPLPLKPAGKDIGDILHGVERNRGVTGSAGFHDQPGFGDGLTGHSEATTDQQGRPVGSGTTGAGAGIGSQQAGREFPLGHSKHDSGYTDKTSPTHASSHTGRDAAALGGAGLVREHEQHKHDNTTTSQYSGLTGSHGQSGLSGAQDYNQHSQGTSGLGSSTGQYQDNSSSLTGSKTSDLSGRNRLHKDPPASHPAAQGYSGSDSTGGHVPASGSERERLVDQGKVHLDRDSGVANAPPSNTGTNY